MFGTIAIGRVKKDKVRELMALGKEWDSGGRKRAAGYINSEILWSDNDDGRLMMIVRFVNKDLYMKNAASPEQHAFYQKLRACLEEDPTWFDGTFGGWDSAYAQTPELS